jgi:sugar lactone lactonase YvrE
MTVRMFSMATLVVALTLTLVWAVVAHEAKPGIECPGTPSSTMYPAPMMSITHQGSPASLRWTKSRLASSHDTSQRLLAPVSNVRNNWVRNSGSIVNVRRDISSGLPWGSAHSEGVSSIVWGSATPNATLVITLTRSTTFVITRTLTADQAGSFSVSVDRLIEDGDVVQVFDGTNLKTVQVPAITFHADPVTKIITGTAPGGITTTISGAPHSFQVSVGGNTRQVTTTATGEFYADFSAGPYLAGLLGTLRYTTPDGDGVYKPLFVADPLVRGTLGDWRADVILGQPDFSQITPNEVVGNKLFNPMGVYVDRSVQPNRIYVYDAGNSRVLGLSHLGVCMAGANEGQGCTTDSDCPGSSCQIQEKRVADIVLGQPSFHTSACNGDSGYQLYPDVQMASAETLCGLREEQMSISEGGSAATMATDAHGNLYVPDFFNNRVLLFNDPFATDAKADQVWGQADFAGVFCNRGAGYGRPDRRSLCLAQPVGYGDLMAGLAVDSSGNLWVADNRNHRVLRFPFDLSAGMPAQEADLVLGQPDFSTAIPGYALDQMHNPASVRVDQHGVVYVADGAEGGGTDGRVLVFEPPLSNGMSAGRTLVSGLTRPTGLEIAPDGSLWINDCDGWRLLNVAAGTIRHEIHLTDQGLWGGLGVDRDGNVMIAGGGPQEVLRFSAPSYVQNSAFLRSEPTGMFNEVGPRGLRHGRGLAVAAGQLVAADGERLLFWNNPWSLTNYQPADGVIGQPDFHTRPRWVPEFASMRADDHERLWVVRGVAWEDAVVYGYQLPLKNQATPILTLTSPLPLQGGGVFTWTGWLSFGGLDIQTSCDCLWMSDKDNHRAFRIRNVSTEPVVDVVLGQVDASGTECNQGRGRSFPSQDSLCHPGALTFDRAGNLYVADHNLEFEGNLRLLEFDANTIPDAPASAILGIPATRVFGRDGDFTEPNCLSREQDPMCGPWEPAFDSRGRMVIGFNGYLGPRFPMVYQYPLTNPLPMAALGDFHSMPLPARFDQFDNLYILDHNRNRILIYRDRQVQTYTVTGAIKTASGAPVPGVQVETIGYASSGISDASGMYTLTGLITGTYQLVPSKNSYTFMPATRTVGVPPDMEEQDFVVCTPIYLPLVLRNRRE